MSQKWMLAWAVGILSMFVTTAGGLLIHFSGIKGGDETPAVESKRTTGKVGLSDAGANEEGTNSGKGWGRGEARAAQEAPRFFTPSEGGGGGRGGGGRIFMNVRMIPIPIGGG